MRTLLLMAVGVVAVSLSGPLMAAMVVPPLAISFWRNGFATVLLAPGVVARRRDELVQVRGRSLGLVVGSGLALAVHFGTWVTSLTLTSVASATAIVCLQVAWVVAWQLLQGVRFNRGVVAGLVLAFAGVLVVSGVDFSLSTRALVGDLLALVGGMASAAYMLIGARARQTVSTTTYTFVCYGSCALALLVACRVSGQAVLGYDVSQWALLLVVTLTAQLMGHSVFNHLLATTSPVLVSLALLLEVPGASLLAAAILGQVPPAAAIVGLVVILVGMALVIVYNRGPVPEQAPLD
ncbi:MAG: DMT family transporter [Nocardioidaceae bacterium]|nr:DMT family transporter [Nocardioidaceae bacterium]NUS51445.1 DMT family transporter [Nocardioidaceae bacterium]